MTERAGHVLQATRYRHFGELPGVELQQHGELLALHVANDSATATVFLQGAQLSHYQRHGEHPVIWCSPRRDYRAGAPLRGGVPVCWPWFGDLLRNPAAVRREVSVDNPPAHGFARNRLWRLDAIEQPRGDLTRILMSLELDSAEEAAWPTAFALQLTIEFGNRLRISLAMANRGARAVCLSAALHSYYAVGDIGEVQVEGLDRLNYIDCAAGWSHGRQLGPLSIDGETDRIYHGTWSPLKLVDRAWRRVLLISPEGSDSTVVWNPWTEKARRLSNFPEEAFREMLCVETARAGDDFLVLEPGDSHRLGFTVRCKPI